jgi:hypothetical protein
MEFGVRKADAPERGSGVYLRGFAKGETKVRFLQEQDDWIEFWEHRTATGKGYPCTGDKTTCPGCTSEIDKQRKASRRYGTYLLLVEKDKVLPFKIPGSLADRIAARAEKNNGTILNRDYSVMKTGEGLETEYDVDQEDKYEVDTAKRLSEAELTVQQCLQESWKEAWGDTPAIPAQREAPAAEHVPGDENPPTEPKGEQAAPASEESVELTEAKVRAMDRPELRELCDKAGVEWSSTDTAGELADKLIAKFGTE